MDSSIRDYDLLAKRIDVLEAGFADAVARGAILERPWEMSPDHLQAWFAYGGAAADSVHAGGEEAHRKGVEAGMGRYVLTYPQPRQATLSSQLPLPHLHTHSGLAQNPPWPNSS